jgi:hypothetical protein
VFRARATLNAYTSLMPSEFPTLANDHALAVMFLTVLALYLFSKEKHTPRDHQPQMT